MGASRAGSPKCTWSSASRAAPEWRSPLAHAKLSHASLQTASSSSESMDCEAAPRLRGFLSFLREETMRRGRGGLNSAREDYVFLPGRRSLNIERSNWCQGDEKNTKAWRCGESNPVPLACEASALPYELHPLWCSRSHKIFILRLMNCVCQQFHMTGVSSVPWDSWVEKTHHAPPVLQQAYDRLLPVKARRRCMTGASNACA